MTLRWLSNFCFEIWTNLTQIKNSQCLTQAKALLTERQRGQYIKAEVCDFPVMTERTRLISYLLYGVFSAILAEKLNFCKNAQTTLTCSAVTLACLGKVHLI